MSKSADAKPTTTIRIYEDTHYRLRVWVARQKPKPTLQDVVGQAIDEFLDRQKKRH